MSIADDCDVLVKIFQQNKSFCVLVSVSSVLYKTVLMGFYRSYHVLLCFL